MHSVLQLLPVKRAPNFHMRVKNMDAGTYARFFPQITERDLAALAWVPARERTPLAALPLFSDALPCALVRRARCGAGSPGRRYRSRWRQNRRRRGPRLVN
jgi:hypothetical protein